MDRATKDRIRRQLALRFPHPNSGGLTKIPPKELHGDMAGIWGDPSGIKGNASMIKGNVTGISAHVSEIVEVLESPLEDDL